jgi:catechol 2,3-dioxygenase-like lactoylglutathione lyase family enzyme
MRNVTGVSYLVLTTPDVEATARSYERLLDAPSREQTQDGGDAGRRFDLAGASFVIRAGTQSGLSLLVFAVVDLDDARKGFARCGLASADPVDASREAAFDRAASFGLPVALTDRAPGPAQTDIQVGQIVIRTPNPERALALYGGRLGLDMRLDRSNPAWNTRFLFFRCGDLVVEIVHRLSDGVSDADDTFGGLSWRVADIEAAHARLTKMGFTLSPVRSGRQPGSRVCTVRDGTAGVPTILIGQ